MSKTTYSYIPKNHIRHIGPCSLQGLNKELSIINSFCSLAWSDDWKHISSVFSFFPTILLYGPPGTGKTSAIKTIANNFLSTYDVTSFRYYRENIDLIIQKELGETSKSIRDLFSQIKNEAKNGFRVILHLEDIDSLLASRYIQSEATGIRRAVNTFFLQLDELISVEYEMTPLLFATSNMHTILDVAISRRFSLKLSIDPELTNEDIIAILQPMIDIIGLKIQGSAVTNIIRKNRLRPYDIILVMQNLLLRQKSGDFIDESELINSLQTMQSSADTMESQKRMFASS